MMHIVQTFNFSKDFPNWLLFSDWARCRCRLTTLARKVWRICWAIRSLPQLKLDSLPLPSHICQPKLFQLLQRPCFLVKIPMFIIAATRVVWEIQNTPEIENAKRGLTLSAGGQKGWRAGLLAGRLWMGKQRPTGRAGWQQSRFWEEHTRLGFGERLSKEEI